LVRTQKLAGGAPIIILWRTGGVGFATEKSVRESNEKIIVLFCINLIVGCICLFTIFV
jgi:hypothetical protein